MAELKMTEEEKAAATWFELDDATIGKMVKMGTLTILNSSKERERMWWYSAALLLCNLAADANADKFIQEITGLSHGDKPLGDWRITLERLK